MQHTFNYRL